MFDRFNDTARRVIALAGAKARELGHDGIGTRHILLALTLAATADGQPNAAATIMTALKVSPEALSDQLLHGLPTNNRLSRGHLPFTPNVQRALQACAGAADEIGDNHIGPEHLLAGLAENPDSGAGKLLLGAGITAEVMPSAIKGSIPAPDPTGARSFNVYLVADAGPFEGGPTLYPRLAVAQLAHPDKQVTGLRATLHDGEFFEVCSTDPGHESWGNFASYSDAFTVAEALAVVGRRSVTVSIIVPRRTDIRGKDNRGHDVILGRTIDYTTASIASRISGTFPPQNRNLPMFERYTAEARRAVVLAQEEARMLNHSYIGTEHLLLALLKDRGIAGQALADTGVTHEEVADHVIDIIGQGNSPISGHIPFTPRAKTVLEAAFRTALKIGHSYIGPEHLLLGLTSNPMSISGQAIFRCGVANRTVTLRLAELMTEQTKPAPLPEPHFVLSA